MSWPGGLPASVRPFRPDPDGPVAEPKRPGDLPRPVSATVRYYCPRCETVLAMEREGYLADKSVTPYPLEGWTYASPDAYGDGTDAAEDVDGVRFVCGESAGVDWEDEGCGEPFYLNFVRFVEGVEVDPEPERESVELAGAGPRWPRGPPGPGD